MNENVTIKRSLEKPTATHPFDWPLISKLISVATDDCCQVTMAQLTELDGQA